MVLMRACPRPIAVRGMPVTRRPVRLAARRGGDQLRQLRAPAGALRLGHGVLVLVAAAAAGALARAGAVSARAPVTVCVALDGAPCSWRLACALSVLYRRLWYRNTSMNTRQGHMTDATHPQVNLHVGDFLHAPAVLPVGPVALVSGLQAVAVSPHATLGAALGAVAGAFPVLGGVHRPECIPSGYKM